MILLIPIISTIAIANQPPTIPHITGSTTVKPGVKETYGFCSEDPDGDDLNYTIKWGDGTEEVFGPVSPGLCATLDHSWSGQGKYTIEAMASDGQADSGWGELKITVPRSRTINSFFQSFFQQFPILRLLLLLY